MSSTKNPGRFAGLLYVFMSIVGFFAMGYFVALALYDLLKGVNRRHASLMVTLIAVSIPIAFLNELNSIAALVLVCGTDFLSTFESLSGMRWLCCSSICIITDLLSPKYFGVCGSFHSHCLCTGRDSCRGSWASGSPSPASPG
jgi:hypothetical protein